MSTHTNENIQMSTNDNVQMSANENIQMSKNEEQDKYVDSASKDFPAVSINHENVCQLSRASNSAPT